MNGFQKRNGRASSMPMGLCCGAIVSAAITIAGTVAMAFLLDGEKMKWSSVGYGVLVMLLLASFLGAYAACCRIKVKYLLVSLLSGGMYLSILLCLTLIFFGGQFCGVGETTLLILAGSISGGLIKIYASKNSQKTRMNKRYRL